ncbi:sirohydrochlorin ferrochelatase [Pseudonocardia sediminis]|uniref:Sirohydrochlorin ferrochelatase n=1 Tax=Pseudonocardia sediminis TaxID=1397368 RepID=A0A4Q7V4T1_PSEST|nr:sirohydrochlorin chelatase [Pseudonocardia sediminis]RZT87629.1 sirohydrochlorin ferrochelatase [Pseudonocardia sediminis]
MTHSDGAPVLVVVAHGSRDLRSAATVSALVDVTRALAPDLDVRLAFLDLNLPRLPEVLASVGSGPVVVVPLLLGSAYHARVDIPAAVDAAVGRLPHLRVTVADVLGPDPQIVGAARRRLAEQGCSPDDPGLGVVLAAAGSGRPGANDVVHRIAAGWPLAGAAFAAAAEPDVTAAIADLRRRGAHRIAVAPWFLAPGRLLDRVYDGARAADPDAVLAGPLGAEPSVARVVLDRYAASLSDSVPGSLRAAGRSATAAASAARR